MDIGTAQAQKRDATWRSRHVGFPPEVVERYRDAGLWQRRTLAEELHATALAHPERDAVVAAQGRLSYRALDERTDQIAAGLAELGLDVGEPVLMQATNRLETVVVWYGLLKAGLVPVATLAAHRGHEIGHISRQVGATAHLVEAGMQGTDLVAFAVDQARDHPTLRRIVVLGATDDDDLPPTAVRLDDLGRDIEPASARSAVEAIQREIDPDEIAVFQLSGGTTGVPKIIPRQHAEYWYNARTYARTLGWDETSRVAHLIPVIHNAGVVCGIHAPHSVGGCLVLATHNLDTALPLVAAESSTDILLGHVHYRAVEHHGFPSAAQHLRQVILSGAKVPPPLFDALEDRGIWVGQLFGMAEGMFAVTPLNTGRRVRLNTVGVPISALDEVVICEPGTEKELADGEIGELCARGPYTLRGYFDAPEHNAQTFTADGFYRTGDLAAVTAIDGLRCLSIEGRIKDLINRGGEKINTEEVELLLLRHPRIVEAAVVPMPDPRLGERGCAYVVTDGAKLDLEELRRHLDDIGVAKFKWPERVELLNQLPRTKVGKLDKKQLTTDIHAKLHAEGASS